MNEHPATTQNNGASRIDEGAERVKQATSNAVAGAKEAVNRAADHIESGLHHATDKVASGAHHASDTLSDAGERGRAAYDATMDRADEWLGQVRDYVREKPVQSVAIALGAGWLLGRLLRR
jgi:ElaB/YqjD/DUF883 family membrane-anchored ribosome-binding protein